jgi:hypothetical protein
MIHPQPLLLKTCLMRLQMSSCNLINSYFVSSLFLIGLLTLPYASALPAVNQAAQQVPPEYQELYSILKASLDSFNANLTALNSAEGSPIFGAELLPANSNRGDSLLAPNVMQAVTLP